jgi:hypothetical protein
VTRLMECVQQAFVKLLAVARFQQRCAFRGNDLGRRIAENCIRERIPAPLCDADLGKGVLSRNRRKFRQPINVACPSPGRWGRPNSRVTSRHFDHGNASRMSRPDCSGLDGAD